MRGLRMILGAGAAVSYLLVTGCASTSAPLADQITQIPVSNKADIQSGLKMEYFFGTQEGGWNHVACNADQGCWFSGHAMILKGPHKRINPLVLRTTANGGVAWARTYQVNDNYTLALGTLPTGDGGALLYGNSFLAGVSGTPTPVYEKLAADGTPAWGGYVPLGLPKPWFAFTDAVGLAGGGFALAGSGFIHGKMHGVMLRVDASGHEQWFASVRSDNQPTLLTYAAALSNGHLLGAGYNGEQHDIVLFDFAPDGSLASAPILHIDGDEVPVGVISLPTGPVVIAAETMPSGESAALIIRLDNTGQVVAASRYRFTDGLNPYDAIILDDGALCLYGQTEAHEHPQSLAFTIGKNTLPTAALLLDGDEVFMSGASLAPGKLIFAGERDLGAKQHASGIAVTWEPALHNDAKALAGISREPIKVTEHQDEGADERLPKNRMAHALGPAQLSSRVIATPSGASALEATPAGP